MNSEFVELIIRDYSGAKTEFFKWRMNDKGLERKIFHILRNKYGIFQQEKKDRDLDWLKDNE